MSVSSKVPLAALRLQAQQRSDLENSPNISTPEWNLYISQSYKELYDMLVSAYGNDYFVATPYQFSTGTGAYYSLPSDFYKLLGVDLQYSGSPTGWISLRRFELIERNKYLYPNTATNYSGYTNLRYRLSGNQIEFIPLPSSGQLMQLLYIPEPTSLIYTPVCSTTLSSATVSMADVSGLTVGMQAQGTGVPSNTVISSIDTALNTVVLSAAATATQSSVVISFWDDAVTLDGIAGWEEYVIIDAAIKAQIKQERPIDELMVQKAAMKLRIESMAEGRDAGQAHHVSDVMSLNGWGYDGFGSDGGIF